MGSGRSIEATRGGGWTARLRVGAVLALVAGFALRLWFYRHYAHVAGDSLVYGDIARNLLQHGVYGFSNDPHAEELVRPTLIRLPGYPLFLALCFKLFGVEKYVAVLFVQIAADLWTCLLVSGLARRLFGARAGAAALWLAALCPFTANYTIAPLTETLTVFTIALAFYGLERWREALGQGKSLLNRWLVVVGGALAYSLLLRPEQGILAAAVVPAAFWLGWKKVSLRAAFTPAVLLSVMTLLPLVPWAARNEHTFHVFQPLAPRFANDPGEVNPAGFQRWYRTWAIDFASTDAVYWRYDGDNIFSSDLPNRAFDSQAQFAATDQLLDDYDLNTTASPALDTRFNDIALERIHADPLRYYIALPAARVLNMMFRPRADMLPVPLEWWKYRTHPRATAFAAFYAALNLGYFVLAGMTVLRVRLWHAHRPLVWTMLASIWLRCALLLTIDNSEPRYTLEFFPVLLVLGAAQFLRD